MITPNLNLNLPQPFSTSPLPAASSFGFTHFIHSLIPATPWAPQEMAPSPPLLWDSASIKQSTRKPKARPNGENKGKGDQLFQRPDELSAVKEGGGCRLHQNFCSAGPHTLDWRQEEWQRRVNFCLVKHGSLNSAA